MIRALGFGIAGGLAGCSGGSGGGTTTKNRDGSTAPAETSGSTPAGEAETTTDPSTRATDSGTVTDRGPTTESGTPSDRSYSLRTGTVSAGELPSYANLVPDLGGGATAFTVFDTESEADGTVANLPEDPTDPLRYDGLVGALAGRVAGAFLLSATGGFRVERLGIDDTERMLTVGGVGVQVMPVDLDGLVSDVDESDAEVRYRADDRVVFSGPEKAVFGATADAFAFTAADQSAFDPVERVRAILDARTGATEPKHAVDDDFASLLRHTATGGSVAYAYAPERDLASLVEERRSQSSLLAPTIVADGVGSATGGVFELDLANGPDPQPATATLGYPSGDAIDGDALTAQVGTAAEDRSYVRDGTTVRIEGSYTWEDLSAYVESSGIGAA